MGTEKELFQRLITDYQGDDLPAYLAAKMSNIRQIKTEVSSIKNRMADAKKKHEVIIEQLRIDLCEVQKSCPHLSTTYYGDPSGGNDSFNECDHCGTYL